MITGVLYIYAPFKNRKKILVIRKVETDIIMNITVRLIGRAVIMDVKTFKPTLLSVLYMFLFDISLTNKISASERTNNFFKYKLWIFLFISSK